MDELKWRHTKKLATKLEALWPFDEGRSSAKPMHMAKSLVNQIYADLLIAGIEDAVEHNRPVARLDDVAVSIDVRFGKVVNLLIRRGTWDAQISGQEGDWTMVDGADGGKIRCITWQSCIIAYYTQWTT